MATVFLARDEKHGRRVAVKVLRPDLAASLGAKRFLWEIGIAAQLQHPHILGLIDSGEATGFLYYVMPFIEGESLRGRMDRGPMPPEEVVALSRQVGDALEHAHRQGVIHRDIKPENILLSDGHAIVADFGIATAVTAASDRSITRTGFPVGTVGYMSPEQAAGFAELNERSDVFSLTCVIYEMLVGQVPGMWPSEESGPLGPAPGVGGASAGPESPASAGAPDRRSPGAGRLPGRGVRRKAPVHRPPGGRDRGPGGRTRCVTDPVG